MDRFLARFLRDENGATAIEYGLIAALVFMVAVGAISAFGKAATDMFQMIADTVDGAVNGA
jgi:pilus assembly protein Flp/PilA